MVNGGRYAWLSLHRRLEAEKQAGGFVAEFVALGSKYLATALLSDTCQVNGVSLAQKTYKKGRRAHA